MHVNLHDKLDTPLCAEMRDVSKKYKNFSMKDFSLSLPQGEILGLIGPNGAGKSTCLNLLMGFTAADAGSIRVLGFEHPKAMNQIKQQVAYISEDMRLYPTLDLAWHMEFVAKLCPNWSQTYADKLRQCFELPINQTLSEFSLGQRIKASLVLALARRPKLLVLDEPSTGLDPVARYELSSQLFEVMLNEEHSVIFSSQYTQDVERLSDTIAFMDRGQLLSLQDKESYIEQWRRIEITTPKGERNIDIAGLTTKQCFGDQTQFTLSQFSGDTLNSLSQQGFSVLKSSAMTLEEIFIAQVIGRRSHNIVVSH